MNHAVVRAGLRALITAEPTMKLVGEAAGGYEALELVKAYLPNVVVLDLSMPDMDEITVTRRIKADYPDIRVLMLTIHSDQALLKSALTTGASGYILKHAAESELISAIHIIFRGDAYIDPTLLPELLNEEAASFVQAPKHTDALTRREMDVLQLIVQGYTNRQIRQELNISIRTVESHRANLTTKLGMHNRVDLVRYAREHNLI